MGVTSVRRRYQACVDEHDACPIYSGPSQVTQDGSIFKESHGGRTTCVENTKDAEWEMTVKITCRQKRCDRFNTKNTCPLGRCIWKTWIKSSGNYCRPATYLDNSRTDNALKVAAAVGVVAAVAAGAAAVIQPCAIYTCSLGWIKDASKNHLPLGSTSACCKACCPSDVMRSRGSSR